MLLAGRAPSPLLLHAFGTGVGPDPLPAVLPGVRGGGGGGGGLGGVRVLLQEEQEEEEQGQGAPHFSARTIYFFFF